MTTLLDLAQEDTTLTYRNGEWHGLCPLHQEKTASFSVNDERGLFHCFGCGKGGDLVSYLIEKRGLSMREALTRAGKILPFPLTPAERDTATRTHQHEARKRAAHDRLMQDYWTWWQEFLLQWKDLLADIEIAEIVYRSMCRAPHVWTEAEHRYWSLRIGRLYGEYDVWFQDRHATEAERFARWQETRKPRPPEEGIHE